MGKGGIVFYFWGADATEKGSLGPNTVVNSNQKTLIDQKTKLQQIDNLGELVVHLIPSRASVHST